MKSFIVAIFSTLLFTSVQAVANDNSAQLATVLPYKVNPGDILRANLWDEPQLQGEVVVLPDLTISFPLVGLIDVANKSIAEITQLFTNKLAVFIPQAHVNIALQQIRGSKFYVIGKVNRPGEFPLEGQLRVLQALSVAGGLSTFADEDGVKVLRAQTDGTQRSISVDYSKILKGKGLDGNILIQSGDVVIVP